MNLFFIVLRTSCGPTEKAVHHATSKQVAIAVAICAKSQDRDIKQVLGQVIHANVMQ